MPDILLIQPPIRDFYLTAKRTIPYGLACVAAALIEAGYSVDIADGLSRRKSRRIRRPPEMDYLEPYYGRPDRSPFALFHPYRHYGSGFEAIADKAEKASPFLIGISSLSTPYHEEALNTARSVKRRLPQCPIVLGGHHPTALPEAVMACPSVDYALRGEGEASMPALARALAGGTGIENVPGIVYRKPGGDLHVSEPAFMADPDRYPLPAIRLVDRSAYRRRSGNSAVVVTSRGCPMHCSYCSLGSAAALPYRRRSVEKVAAEIETAVVSNGARFIDFEDENLSLDRRWFTRLLETVIRRFGKMNLELRAMNGLFPPALDFETLALMKKAGFRTLNLSLGTADPAQAKRFHRTDVHLAFDQVTEWAGRLGLSAVGYIIVGAPFQSPRTSLSDLLFLARRRVLAGVSVYYPVPDTRDHERCRRIGALPSRLSLYRSSALPISHTTSRKEAVTLLRIGRVLNFMKSQIDEGPGLPEPLPLAETAVPDTNDRTAIGRRLLGGFLHDGAIRGITPEGSIYPHAVSRELTDRFVREIGRCGIAGTR